MASKDTKKLVEFLKLEMGKRLCKSVHYHIVGRAIKKSNMTLRYGLADEMKGNVNVFGATMKCGVL